MIKHPEENTYKICDYSDLIGWEIVSVMETNQYSGKDKIFFLTIHREGNPSIKRYAFCEQRYLPVKVIHFIKRGNDGTKRNYSPN